MSPERFMNIKGLIFLYQKCLAPVMSSGSTCLDLEVNNKDSDYETHHTGMQHALRLSSPLTELRN